MTKPYHEALEAVSKMQGNTIALPDAPAMNAANAEEYLRSMLIPVRALLKPEDFTFLEKTTRAYGELRAQEAVLKGRRQI